MKIIDQLPVLGFPKNFIELFNEIPETMGTSPNCRASWVATAFFGPHWEFSAAAGDSIPMVSMIAQKAFVVSKVPAFSVFHFKRLAGTK
jgi:hypothetical protein